jgi:hypothetical protein
LKTKIPFGFVQMFKCYVRGSQKLVSFGEKTTSLKLKVDSGRISR